MDTSVNDELLRDLGVRYVYREILSCAQIYVPSIFKSNLTCQNRRPQLPFSLLAREGIWFL